MAEKRKALVISFDTFQSVGQLTIATGTGRTLHSDRKAPDNRLVERVQFSLKKKWRIVCQEHHLEKSVFQLLGVYD